MRVWMCVSACTLVHLGAGVGIELDEALVQRARTAVAQAGRLLYADIIHA